MSILSLLGWLFIGKEGVKNSYTNYKTNIRAKEIFRNDGNAVYMDSQGKMRMISNNKRVYSIQENGHTIYRYVDTGAVAFDATSRSLRQKAYNYYDIAKILGKKGVPAEIRGRKIDRQMVKWNYEHGIEIGTGKEYWIKKLSNGDRWYYFTEDALYFLDPSNEENTIVKQLTKDEAAKYRDLDLIRYHESIPRKDPNDCSDIYFKYGMLNKRHLEEIKRVYEQPAIEEHEIRMRRLYGENWEEREDTRERKDVCVFDITPLFLTQDTFYFIYNNYTLGKNGKYQVDWLNDEDVDKRGWFTLCELIKEYFQKLFNERESEWGYIRVTDVQRDMPKEASVIDPFTDYIYWKDGERLTFRIVFDNILRFRFADDYQRYLEEYSPEYLKKIRAKEDIELIRDGRGRGGANSDLMWYLLCKGDMSRVDDLKKGLIDYIKKEMIQDEIWKANYEKGVKLANEQKEKARDNENQSKD